MHGQADAHEQGRTLCVRFNQTGGCFACGTEAGIRVYNCDPFKETVGGVRVVVLCSWTFSLLA